MAEKKYLADVASKVVTVVLHPLLLPIYCTLLVFYTPTPYAAMPTIAKACELGFVCFFACLVPLVIIGVLIALGKVSGIEMSSRSERCLPLSLSAFAIVCSLAALNSLIPACISGMVAGEAAVLFVAAVLSFFWKVSLHAIGVGALLAFISVSGVAFHQDFSPLAAAAFVAAGVTAWTRLHEEAHTPAQLLVGYAIGFVFMGAIMNVALLRPIL